MGITRIVVILTCVSLSTLKTLSQEALAQGGDKTSGVYLRIANIMPLGKDKVSITRQSEAWLSGLKPGFFSGYQKVQADQNTEFSLKISGRPFGSFKIEINKAEAPKSFHTLIIYGDTASPRIHYQSDKITTGEDEKSIKPLTGKIFRGYFGGFSFPYQIVVEGIGEWDIHNKAQLIEIPLTTTPPKQVIVVYKDRYEEEIRLPFPLDFESTGSCSVFVSQRGIQRPRLSAFPDNLPPLKETLGNDIDLPNEL
ncbi:MAG: hypothetical protein AAF558_10025 [Verrucomicrobiota bacterium]